ncbi:hypothetical protein E4U17_002066 [Claviceps sp. LM77 group G4]|nr:hypothetical protein E4U17_002066 [Claviceps sp. LM77 group G4]KAG6077024.1 hypothetical protein E4U16_002476 [Claviceps sp. LM84 group G4]KAG6079969.1 hypothetical protein E4U33_008045 [Claviceps sp. LM78 group G4]
MPWAMKTFGVKPCQKPDQEVTKPGGSGATQDAVTERQACGNGPTAAPIGIERVERSGAHTDGILGEEGVFDSGAEWDEKGRSDADDECCGVDSSDVEGGDDEGGEAMDSGARRSSGTVAAADATLIGSGSQSGVDDVAAAGAAREAGNAGGAVVVVRSPSASSSTATPASAGESDGDGNGNNISDGDGRAIADGNASLSAGSDAVFAPADKVSRLRWRTRSRNEGRALSRGRSPGCMHTA